MTANRIDEIAAGWVAREDAAPLDAAAAARRDAWLQADPRHAGAHARARAVLVHAGRAGALGPGFDPLRFAPRGNGPGRLRHWFAAAAVLVLAVGMLVLLPRDEDYRTSLGEIRRLPLADGSVMTLNTDSEVEVRYGGRMREIRLLQGEALFDVARDPARPFVVASGKTRVRAVGTSFSVRRLPTDATEVVVREGRVQVAIDGAAQAAEPMLLGANQRAVATADRRVRRSDIAEARVRQALSWQDGMIAFDGDTLAEAAREFARYGPTRLRIDDPAVARLRVVGLYAANDPEGFARAVALSQGIEYRREGEEVLLLRGEGK